MRIEEVIDISIVGIFSDKYLSDRLVLKGGAALRLMENLDERLSTDMDFSTREAMDGKLFDRLEKVLARTFKRHKYDVIDFKPMRKPKESRDRPKWWGGWRCGFKLSQMDKHNLSAERRRKQALIPEGSNSSVVEIEISEYEYCGRVRHKKIKGVRINGYSRPLLVVEKLRAICQQHPSYKYRTKKNRARDLVDIYHLTKDHRTERFLKECRTELPESFEAKEVDVDFLDALNEEKFSDTLRAGFPQVEDDLKDRPYPFETYLEYVRDLVNKIRGD